jgi:hypothetical protein
MVYMTQAHSAEEWSHLRSNPLELSSSLRSKWLTENYYASLALVFKLVRPSLDSWYSTKLLVCTVVRDATVTGEHYLSYSTLNLTCPNSVNSNKLLHCPSYSVTTLQCPRNPNVQ